MRCSLKTLVILVVQLCFLNAISAQFAPAAQLSGTTAIAADSSVFVAWAAACAVERGPMNIADTGLGLASAGVSDNGIGAPDAITVSLGDGGRATLTFNRSIYDGPGVDFAVFENGFLGGDPNLAFLELGFVEVSTDGNRYVRFAATGNVEDTAQFGNGSYMDCRQINNLAGKYAARYGTPFDLHELIDSPGIDVSNINYVRIVDVVGSIDSAYGTRDHNGHLINDPWPTPFASCGFDLDAVGVIHANGVNGIDAVAEAGMNVYPVPARCGDAIKINLIENDCTIKLFNVGGLLLNRWAVNGAQSTINTNNLSGGMYFITAEGKNSHLTAKLIVE